MREQRNHEFEYRMIAADGRIVWLRDMVSVILAAGQPIKLRGVMVDITEHKRAEEALRESEERLRFALEAAKMGTWEWNVLTDKSTWSDPLERVHGLTPGTYGGTYQHFLASVYPDDREYVRQAVAHAVEAGTDYDIEFRIVWPDGSIRWMARKGRAICDETGRAIRMLGVGMDITERKQAEEQRMRYALHDALTGLPNRVLFIDRLGCAVERAKRHAEYRFAVLFLDLDCFKEINDRLGHIVGDQLLAAVAQRLEACVRIEDTVARLGGDEFVILLDDITDTSDAIHVADRIQAALQEPIEVSSHQVLMLASIGITLSTTGYERPEDVLRDADTAMYRAKTSGKARYEVVDAAMHARVLALSQLQTDLRRAVRARSSNCSTSRLCRCQAVRSSESRRCCAGSIPSVA